MDEKKGAFLIILFLIMFSFSVSADVCDIQTSCANENTVLKLSSQTNAHGEYHNQGNYNYYLCCNFTGTHIPDGNNRILHLSFPTNAHAEMPSLNNYNSNVYFGDLECASNSGSCPAGYDIEMLSLSSNTNAHLAYFDYYPVKVCCRHRCLPDCSGRECGMDPVCGTLDCGSCSGSATCNENGRCVSEEIYWANVNNPIYSISYLEVVPGVTQVALVLNGIEPPEGTVSFEIYEDGLVDTQEIRTGSDALNADVDEFGSSVAYWTITQEDIENAQRIEDIFDLDNFYFEANSKQSGDLALSISGGSCININYCRNYDTQTMCEQDTCLVAEESIEVIPELDVTCGVGYVCGCSWNNTSNNCSASWQPKNDSNGNGPENSPIGIGTCNYDESSNDNCDDGFLTYSWIADIDWPADNTGWTNQSGCIAAGGDPLSCVLFDGSVSGGFIDGLWHYDPMFSGVNSLLTECIGGSSTLQCPAQVQLPAFTLKNFLIAIVILIGSYIIYNQQKNKKKKTSKRNKKKK